MSILANRDQLVKEAITLGRAEFTINTFQHFVYLYSKKTLVLADIKASESHSRLSQNAVLFDLMEEETVLYPGRHSTAT
ncbi:hypothetical protein R3P38DRAFT_3245311 [Favolaschia claudopus]|uniref:Uncharacterized protein n=1 Tax=Favolaschia claudopus TaxID=2862362 RepID=A0AAV9Z110_9AGAR